MRIYLINRLGHNYEKAICGYIDKHAAEVELAKLNDVRLKIEPVELYGRLNPAVDMNLASQVCESLFNKISNGGGKELKPLIIDAVKEMFELMGIVVITDEVRQ